MVLIPAAYVKPFVGRHKIGARDAAAICGPGAARYAVRARTRENKAMRRLATISGVGPLTARAIVTAIGDGRQFDSPATSLPGAGSPVR